MFAILNKSNLENNILKANNICLDLLRSSVKNNRILLSNAAGGGTAANALARILQNAAVGAGYGGALQLVKLKHNNKYRIYHDKNIGQESREGGEDIPSMGVPRRSFGSVA